MCGQSTAAQHNNSLSIGKKLDILKISTAIIFYDSYHFHHGKDIEMTMCFEILSVKSVSFFVTSQHYFR